MPTIKNAIPEVFVFFFVIRTIPVIAKAKPKTSKNKAKNQIFFGTFRTESEISEAC